MFADPLLLKHSHKLLFNIHIVFKAQLYLFLSLQNLLVLIFEENGAETIKFRNSFDYLPMVINHNLLEKYLHYSVIVLAKLNESGRVQGSDNRTLICNPRDLVNEII
jgi:hypothetical protein